MRLQLKCKIVFDLCEIFPVHTDNVYIENVSRMFVIMYWKYRTCWKFPQIFVLCTGKCLRFCTLFSVFRRIKPRPYPATAKRSFLHYAFKQELVSCQLLIVTNLTVPLGASKYLKYISFDCAIHSIARQFFLFYLQKLKSVSFIVFIKFKCDANMLTESWSSAVF
jgi:hypothetical protein